MAAAAPFAKGSYDFSPPAGQIGPAGSRPTRGASWIAGPIMGGGGLSEPLRGRRPVLVYSQGGDGDSRFLILGLSRELHHQCSWRGCSTALRAGNHPGRGKAYVRPNGDRARGTRGAAGAHGADRSGLRPGVSCFGRSWGGVCSLSMPVGRPESGGSGSVLVGAGFLDGWLHPSS